jgi:hypothetical protein
MSYASLATPGTEACDAVGVASRPQWREWPAQAIRRVLSERVAFGILAVALFGLLPSPVIGPESESTSAVLREIALSSTFVKKNSYDLLM